MILNERGEGGKEMAAKPLQDDHANQPLLLTDRWQMIMDLINANNGTTIRELCAQIGMSPNTARRDLEALQKRGLVIRTHGRILPCLSMGRRSPPTVAESRTTNPDLKTAIGKVAATLVQPHDTVLMDGGFTTYQVARHIEARDFHVATNSLDVAGVLATRSDVNLTVIGGDLWGSTGSMTGWFALDQINRINADKAILGNDGVSLLEGLSCFNSEMSLLKRAMSSRAKRVIIVADHTKIGKYCKFTWAEMSKMSTLVTDSRIDPQMLAMLRGAGVEVILAGV